MKIEEVKYEEAFQELQTLVRRMENDELGIDQMAEQLKRAQMHRHKQKKHTRKPASSCSTLQNLFLQE